MTYQEAKYIVFWQKGKKMRLVDLDEVINAIYSTDWYHLFNGKLSEGAEGEESALYKAEDVYKAIGEVPVMDVEFVGDGNWIVIDDEPCKVWACDQCGFILEGEEPYRYCPSCGANMRKKKNE